MDIFFGLPPLLVILALSFVLIVLVFVLALISAYKIADKDWQLTSLVKNTVRVVVSGRGNPIRFLWRSDETYLDKKHNAQPVFEKDGETMTEGARKARPNFLLRWVHLDLNLWWVSIIYPFRRVHEFPVPKARLRKELVAKINEDKNLGDPKNGTINIEDLIEIDEKPSMERELLIYIPRPVLVKDAETSDNFNISAVFSLIVRVTNPDRVLFRFNKGLLSFFPLLDAAVSDAVNSHVRGFEHDTFVKEGLKPGDKGELPPIIKVIKNLNEFYNPTDTTTGMPQGENIKEVLGVEIYQVSVVAYKPDPRATGPVQEVQAATNKAKVKKIEGDAERNYLVEVAKGKIAQSKMLVDVYGDPQLARDERVAELHGSNITTLVNGAANTGIMVSTTPAPPPTKPSETPPTKGEGSPPST